MLLLAPIHFATFPALSLKATPDQSLADSDASFWGFCPYSDSGTAVSIVGDVNGDGYDDIIIGARYDDEIGNNAGKAYLFLGKASDWAMDTDLSSADASFLAEDRGDWAGSAVSGAGDVNGDGLDDFLIAAPFDEDGGYEAGQTYLFLGRTSGWRLGMVLSEADASFWGEGVYDSSGYSISGAGDVNGDGFDDFLISAYRNDEGGTDAGQTYLVLGKRSGWAMDTDLSAADASFIGEHRNDDSGEAVSGAGDVNGDGFDDFLIGAPGSKEGGYYAGQAYLVLGRASGWAMDTNLSASDASFWGEDPNDAAGRMVSGAGDVNGDGFDDLLMAAWDDDDGGRDAGQTYLVLGKASGWAMDTNLSASDASFWGEREYDSAGRGVSAAGDVDGDGFDDFLIAAPYNADGGAYAGKTYLLMGKASGWAMDTNLSTSDASFLGEVPYDYSGDVASGAGDVDGDGFDDILIGAPNNAEGGTSSGQTYLVFPDRNRRLLTVYSVELYPDDSFSERISVGFMNHTVHVRLRGIGGNISRADVTEVHVASDGRYPWGFQLRLHETGADTGIFQGSFTLASRTHKGYHWIGTEPGDTVTVTSIVTPSISATLMVTVRPLLSDHPHQFNITEDVPFSYTFEVSEGIVGSRTLATNADWLDCDPGKMTVSGAPTNLNVGSWWVYVNVSDDYGNGDDVNATINVANTPPVILGEPPTTATEDEYWYYDFDSSDDDQGDIEWHLATDCVWLQIAPLNGILLGTPFDEDVGEWWVNVSVDDGNGGWDYYNFTLTVLNEPDPPVLIPPTPPLATEDVPYILDLDALDPDAGDSLTWSSDLMDGWLRLNTTTGVLSGTPTNDDVGDVFLTVTVTDSTGQTASLELKITVINVNDPPEITTADVTTAAEDAPYRVVYAATDVDAGDVLTWSFERNASWLSFDPRTGVLSGMPTNEDVGTYYVNLTVTDVAGAKAIHNFTLTVVNVNDPPVVTSALPPTVVAREDEAFQMNLTAEDIDDTVLTWSDDTDLFDIGPTNGTIAFLPTQAEVGEWLATVTVTDGGGLSDMVSMHIVVRNVNDAPVIMSLNPATGSTFEHDALITLSAQADDEDGDELTFTWRDGDRIMGVSASLDVTLASGEHRIVLTVSDGMAQVEDSTVVWVKGKADNPPSSILPGLLIIVIIFLVVLKMKWHSFRRNN